MMSSKAEEMFNQIRALSPGDQCRLAAALLDKRDPTSLKTAMLILKLVETEGNAALLHHDMQAARAK